MPIDLVDSLLQARFTESSVIHWSGCWRCAAAKKNSLWNLFALAPELLRSETLSGARLVLWRAPHLSGVTRAPRRLSELRQGKTREAGLVSRQSILSQTLCVVGGAAVPRRDDQGCGQGTTSGLGHGQRAGEAIHARAVAPGGKTGT